MTIEIASTPSANSSAFDERIYQFLPHRPPMLLINCILEVDDTSSSSTARFDESSLFFIPGQGIPTWVGLEVMGQTAALIAGYQQQSGQLEPGTGFLLGCRTYSAEAPYLPTEQLLRAQASQAALVEGGLATFNCKLWDANGSALASAVISVVRQATDPTSNAESNMDSSKTIGGQAV